MLNGIYYVNILPVMNYPNCLRKKSTEKCEYRQMIY